MSLAMETHNKLQRLGLFVFNVGVASNSAFNSMNVSKFGEIALQGFHIVGEGFMDGFVLHLHPYLVENKF